MTHVDPQRLHFIGRELAPLARRQFAQAEGAFTHPYQPPHIVVQQLRDLADLPLAAFAHDDPDPYAVGGALLDLDPGRHRHLAVQLYAIAPTAQIADRRRPIE